MLTTLEMPQDNTVGLRIDGKITEEDITRTTTILEEKLRHHAPLKLYVEYEEIDNFSAGPQISFLLNGKYEYGDEGVSYKFDDRDDFNTIDYGFVVGAGVELGSFFVDARYSLGLNNALEDREINDVFLENEDAKNNSVQVSVGFLF